MDDQVNHDYEDQAMKPAIEWTNEQEQGGGYIELSARGFNSLVQAIQLDAWKQGMTDAAEVVNDARSGDETDLRCIRDRIKSKRDQTTSV